MSELEQMLRDKLKMHLNFLQTSCNLYDQGNTAEAIRMAVSLRVLFYSSKHSKPILKQMGADRIELLSTCPKYKRPNLKPQRVKGNLFKSESEIFMGIVPAPVQHSGPEPSEWRFHAPLENAPVKRWLRYGDWWQEVVHATPSQARDITREVIVSDIANKDGAHADPNPSPEYQAMKVSPHLSNAIERNGQLVDRPLTDFHLVAIRQIVYEVLNSPALLKLCEEQAR